MMKDRAGVGQARCLEGLTDKRLIVKRMLDNNIIPV